MAEQGFGVKKISLIGSASTSKIQTDGELDVIASTVDVTGNINVTGIATVSGEINASTVNAQVNDASGTSNFNNLNVGSGITMVGNTGQIVATAFIGDGGGITGLTGVGAGINIRDSGALIGAAGTIDFGEGLGVSAVSGAAVTITSSSALSVVQTGYGGTNPITVSGGSTIAISSASNAFGTRYISTQSPSAGFGTFGDIWYQI